MIIGVDEVGRGAWAGPLVVGAVQLPHILPKSLDGLDDSKKLTRKQREEFSVIIHNIAIYIGIGWVSATEVDKLGLTNALRLACQRALANAPDVEIIIDGNINFLSENPKSSCLIKADNTVPAVSAASIVAKVARDKYMTDVAAKHPNYGFEKHVGYGVKAHLEALRNHGITVLHRRSFKPVKALL